MLKKYQKIHFVGIGGIGMSGIAEVLLNLGTSVTGSDLHKSAATERLKKKGAKIWIGHSARNVAGAHVVVVSSAIGAKNIEVRAANRMGLPVVPRAEMLAELMRLKYSVAVAGTHGKTTTTSLIAHIVDEARLDPTVIVGGRIKAMGTNAKLGRGEFLIAEADESDRSFLKLTPTIGVITNIDPEHLENYTSFGHLKNAFVDFANKTPFYGSAILCKDHPVVRSIIPKIKRRVITYGQKNADYTAKNITQRKNALSFDVYDKGAYLGGCAVPMAGKHHALNALAAVAAGREMEIPFKTIKKAMASFGGIERRFEILKNGDPIIVDDYGHHPVEIAATVKAAREGWPNARIIAVIQPHRYTRVKALFKEFVSSIKGADAILMMKIYPAGEKRIPRVTSRELFKDMKNRYPNKIFEFTPTSDDVLKRLAELAGKNDLVLFLGAGDITKTAHKFAMGF